MPATSSVIKWSAHAHVDKWDADQTEWVRQRSGLVAPTAADFVALEVAPADTAEAAGNLLTTAGLARVTSLITAAGGQGVTNTAARIGVGNSSTAAAIGDTDLAASAGSSNRYFQPMDATYPTTSNGVITFKATFATGDGNFAWAEWGIDVGTPTVSGGTTVAALLLNRKVASLGTKVSGATWAFTATITLS